MCLAGGVAGARGAVPAEGASRAASGGEAQLVREDVSGGVMLMAGARCQV